MTGLPSDLADLRERVWRAHLELPANGLVRGTSGNVSARHAESGLVVIKPSGVPYAALDPEQMVVVDLDGTVVAGTARPSSDVVAHCAIYRGRPATGGVVHTHSPYATAFAAAHRPIPPLLTAACDEFGGEVPCAGYAPVGTDDIGRLVVEHTERCPAVLLANHGVFTVGPTPEAAVRRAVAVEDVAQTTFLALQLAPPNELPPDEVTRAHRRFVEEYGQPARQDHGS